MMLQKITADLDKINVFGTRVETGPLQINDDWPGLFIRGDNAFNYAMQLETLLKEAGIEEGDIHLEMTRCVLEGLLDDLKSCNMANFREKNND